METTKWLLDSAHSELTFKIKHLMISSISGAFKNFSAKVETEEMDFSKANINLTVEMNSISTNNEQRDEHLRSSDFFEVEKFPQLKFTSTEIEQIDDESFNLHGNLTMKGVTKPVKLNMEFNGIMKDPQGQEKAGFLVSGKINRSDWGINLNVALETGGLMLGEDVRIQCEVQFIKQEINVPVG
ncbi:YceI family protein [Albibacterium bauzanense]|uniref:Polyisoprenoid-binding protein YceI n=1 Tax=Albibacterium bauzanense TaxID=653929 RepID=A0A4R1LXX7_9SPHI|nr:YceI family protein [Albibacterium bauzanense]TCK83384.1 polyisoprenoid-binding protein YceI [Albibacterium bauzanense]